MIIRKEEAQMKKSELCTVICVLALGFIFKRQEEKIDALTKELKELKDMKGE